MFYETLKLLKDSDFKRKCGVKPETFKLMVSILQSHLERRGKRGGQNKLSVEDQLLAVLEYWREYRTQFHIGISWGVSESAVGRLIRKVENILIKAGTFRLPGKQELYQNSEQWEVVVIDVTETPIERPKKTTIFLQW